jgi:phosphatidate cytidylyltransferase
MTTDQEAEGGSPLEPVPMQPVPPPERRTRAGRNLPAAIGVGLGLGVVIVGTL